MEEQANLVLHMPDSEQSFLPISTNATTVWNLPWSRLRLFLSICFVAFLNGAQVCAFMPTELLNLTRLGLASKDDVRFYVLLIALSTGIPIISGMVLGILASRIGAARSLVLSCSIVSISALSLIFARSRYALILGFLGFGLSYSCRTLRQIFVTEIIPSSCRTEAMSILSFFTPAGSLCGPLIWLLCNRFDGEVYLGFGILLNKYTLTFFIVASINALMATTAFMLHLAKTRLDFQTRFDGLIGEKVPMKLEDRQEKLISSYKQSKLQIIAFFCALELLAGSVVAIFSENFQAFLVIYFGADGKHLGLVFEFIVLAELIPPLIVAFAARHLKDRTIVVIGFLLKVLGGILYLPIFSAVTEIQVIVGFALMHKASLFFETAMLSLLSIKFDSSSKGTMMGIVSSSWSLGYVVAQYSFGVLAVRMFGTMSFGFFVLPLLFALLMVLWPSNWQMLDTK